VPVIATCPLCDGKYDFEFPNVGKTKAEWELLQAAKVNFVTTCTRCNGRFRADMNEFLVWKD